LSWPTEFSFDARSLPLIVESGFGFDSCLQNFREPDTRHRLFQESQCAYEGFEQAYHLKLMEQCILPMQSPWDFA
jgi:hypothetical protein